MGFELIAVADAEISFSLNHPSMAWLYEVMSRAGVMGDEQVTPPELPEGWDDGRLEAVATFVESARELTLGLLEVGYDLDEDPASMIGALRQVVRDAPDDEQIGLYDEFESRREAIVTRPGADNKVPAYKFESQDGWLVTPEECRALAEALRQAAEVKGAELYPTEPPRNIVMEEYDKSCKELEVDPDPGEVPEAEEAAAWLEDWIAFNEESAELGGFHVF